MNTIKKISLTLCFFLASAALATSDIPWNGPIGKTKNEF